MSSSIVERVDLLLGRLEAHGGGEIALEAREARRLVNEPLRVAIAGRMKSGKSTLINAIVGRAIAATDATECTRIVTWYKHGPRPGATGYYGNGEPLPLRYELAATSALLTTPQGGPIDPELERIEVTLPLKVLRQLTIIDTPGTASISEQLSARALDSIVHAPSSHLPDVVLYLMRQLHESDVDFLEAFGDTYPAEADPLRAVGILSRADELGSGRGDSMLVSRQLATSLSHHPDLAAVVATVLPVAGQLAFQASTLTDKDTTDLRLLAERAPQQLDQLLRSVRSFTRGDTTIPVTIERRRDLIDRFGLYGLRLLLALMANRAATDTEALRRVLRRHGGIEPILDLLIHRFAGRADVLRSARAAGSVERLAREVTDSSLQESLLADLDALRANSHELEELSALRTLLLDSRRRLDQEHERLVVRVLGGNGTSASERLGLGSADTIDLRTEASLQLAQIDQFPRLRGSARRAAEAARRSLELLLHDGAKLTG